MEPASLVQSDLLEQLESLALLVRVVPRVELVTRETVDHQASLASLGTLELQANLASLVPLDFLEERVR